MNYKVTTHDYRPPIQGGDPIWHSGAGLPCTLPATELDTTEHECAGGWNFTDNLAAALRIAGLWPSGWPSAAFEVEPSSDAIRRGEKYRASQLTLRRLLTEAEIRDGVLEMSQVFGKHAAQMAESQMAWRAALARPGRDEAAVQESLAVALAARGLEDWKLVRLEAWSAWDAWTAWDAWEAWSATPSAWAAREAWSDRASWEIWDARDAWDAWDASAARAAWGVRAAWDARDVWDIWDPWEAREAWSDQVANAGKAAWGARAALDALSVEFAALSGWVNYPADLLSAGLRAAYRSGLAVAFPAGPGELGWMMED